MQMKTYEATVMVQNGSSKIAHTVRVSSTSTFSAQQLLQAQYGSENLVSTPISVTSSPASTFDASPWMLNIGG